MVPVSTLPIAPLPGMLKNTNDFVIFKVVGSLPVNPLLRSIPRYVNDALLPTAHGRGLLRAVLFRIR